MRVISLTEEKYICSLIANASNAHKRETGLERLCALLQKNFRLNYPLETCDLLIARLYDNSKKVTRWALNAIALLGQQNCKINSDAIVHTIIENNSNPEVLCAAFAALFSICGDEEALKIIKERKLPLEDAFILSASQYSSSMFDEIAKKKINLDYAPDLDLKNVAVLIGLDKAPENIFHPKYPNKDVLGKLNLHDNKKVAQYSIWALVENENYNIEDLGLEIKDVESFSENVRAWIYKLMIEKEELALKHKSYIFEVASKDTSNEAREGLASSLIDIYFPQLEECTIDWVNTEQDSEVKALLYDHMASVAYRCPAYKTQVENRYKAYGIGSLERLRLESASEGTNMYKGLKQISHNEESGSLFNLREIPMGDTYNIENNSGIIMGREATVSKSTLSTINKIKNDELKKFYEDFAKFIDTHDVSAQQKEEAEKIIADIAVEPKKTLLIQTRDLINKIKGGISESATSIESAQTIYEAITNLISNFSF